MLKPVLVGVIVSLGLVGNASAAITMVQGPPPIGAQLQPVLTASAGSTTGVLASGDARVQARMFPFGGGFQSPPSVSTSAVGAPLVVVPAGGIQVASSVDIIAMNAIGAPPGPALGFTALTFTLNATQPTSMAFGMQDALNGGTYAFVFNLLPGLNTFFAQADAGSAIRFLSATSSVGGNGQPSFVNQLSQISAVTTPLPEPVAWIGMIIGFGLLGARLRSARRRGAAAGAIDASVVSLPSA
jgi:hypothetical protein